MPYDDPILKELGGYFRAEEPGGTNAPRLGPDKGGHWEVVKK